MESSGAQKHFFDLKLPLGTLLTFYGIVLFLYGEFGPHDIYAKSFDMNVNSIWGVVMILVGAAFLVVSFLGRKRKT